MILYDGPYLVCCPVPTYDPPSDTVCERVGYTGVGRPMGLSRGFGTYLVSLPTVPRSLGRPLKALREVWKPPKEFVLH